MPDGTYPPGEHVMQGVVGFESASVDPATHLKWLQAPNEPWGVYVPGEQLTQSVVGSVSSSVIPARHCSAEQGPTELIGA